MNLYENDYMFEYMNNIGDMFEHQRQLNIDIDSFFEYFIGSNIVKQLENRNPSYLVGKSGAELFYDTVLETGFTFISNYMDDAYISKEYWAGYVLAYFQFKSRLTFKQIYKYIKIKDIINMYHPFHEASEERVFDEFKHIINKSIGKETNLQYIRKRRNLTQKELSLLSNVSIRTIQEYEGRYKDINKASAITLKNMSNVLNCSILDIMEIAI